MKIEQELLDDIEKYVQSTCVDRWATPKQRGIRAAWYLGVAIFPLVGERPLTLDELKVEVGKA